MKPIRRLARRLLANRRATSTIELALLSPILMVVLTGAVDCARLAATKLRLQQAAERTAELATSGTIGSTAFTSLQSEAAAAASVPSSNVTVTYWLECDGTHQNAFDGTCSTGQQVGRYASITIAGSYTPTFAVLLRQAGVDGTIPVSGAASVRVQ